MVSLKEEFAAWLIKKASPGYSAYFGTMEQAISSLNEYNKFFKIDLFDENNIEEIKRVLNETFKNPDFEKTEFGKYSKKKQNHVPRAILWKFNYFKFLDKKVSPQKPISIEKLIDKYKKILRQKGLDEELYKWELVKKFYGKPDINAENFVSEIKGLDFSNLTFRSMGVTNHILKTYPEEYKKSLIFLFNEDVPLNERTNEFLSSVKNTFDKIKSNENDSTFHDERTVSCFLTYRFPEKYVFYKDSYYKAYCDLIGEIPQKVGEKYPHYLELINDLVENYLKNDAELIDLYRSLLPENVFQDKNLKLLAQDLLFRTLYNSKENEKEIDNNGDNKMIKSPLNLILYGPPGTGKTYNTINKALEIIDGDFSGNRAECEKRFAELKQAGQIEFITFHL